MDTTYSELKLQLRLTLNLISFKNLTIKNSDLNFKEMIKDIYSETKIY